MENTEKDFIQIDIMFLLRKLWFRKILILFTTLVFAAAALAYSMFVAVPKYTSTTKVYVVNQEKSEKAVTTQDIQLGNFLVKDYKEIILSNKVMTDVIEKNNLNLSAGALSGKVTVDSPKDTRVLSITVQDKDPQVASDLANSIREVSAAQIKKVTKINDVTTMEEAEPAVAPSSPNIVKNTGLAGAVGFVFICLIVVLKELLDDKVTRPEDVEEVMDMVLLGVIPDTKKI